MLTPSCFIKPSGKPVIHINSEKRVYGEKVLNMVIETIERAIKFAPDTLSEVKNNVIPYFADIIYDEDGVNRLLSFEQFGSFYIAKVYDKYSENTAKYTFLAYSVYDIFDYYNGNLGDTVPYINLGTFNHDTDCTISCCDNPSAYKNTALNESNKFIVTFIDKSKGVIDSAIEMYVSETEISASKKYVSLSSIGIAKRVVGYVTYIVNGTRFTKNYSTAVKELEGKEYAYYWNEIQEAKATEVETALNGKRVVGWEYYNEDQGEQTYLPKLTDLEKVKVKSGVAMFVGVLTDEVEDDFEIGEDDEDEELETPEDSPSGEEGSTDTPSDDSGEINDSQTGSNTDTDQENETNDGTASEEEGTGSTDDSSIEAPEDSGHNSEIDGEGGSSEEEQIPGNTDEPPINSDSEENNDIEENPDFEIGNGVNDEEYTSNETV